MLHSHIWKLDNVKLLLVVTCDLRFYLIRIKNNSPQSALRGWSGLSPGAFTSRRWARRSGPPARTVTSNRSRYVTVRARVWVCACACVRTSSSCRHLPHSASVMRWSSSSSQRSRKGAMQCSSAMSGARMGNSSWTDTKRSLSWASRSHHFQMAALVQRRVRLLSASRSMLR